MYHTIGKPLNLNSKTLGAILVFSLLINKTSKRFTNIHENMKISSFGKSVKNIKVGCYKKKIKTMRQWVLQAMCEWWPFSSDRSWNYSSWICGCHRTALGLKCWFVSLSQWGPVLTPLLWTESVGGGLACRPTGPWSVDGECSIGARCDPSCMRGTFGMSGRQNILLNDSGSLETISIVRCRGLV